MKATTHRLYIAHYVPNGGTPVHTFAAVPDGTPLNEVKELVEDAMPGTVGAVLAFPIGTVLVPFSNASLGLR